MITISAFKWVPPSGQGHVRDLRVRWALEEAGLRYQTRLIAFADQHSAEYRAHQPFGQVPMFEEDGLVLFESGAIVLHVGARSETLLPPDPAQRARAITWLFAAINTIEVVTQQLAEIDFVFAGQEWAKLRRPDVEKRARLRLRELAAWIGRRDYLEDRFTLGDLMMTTVLRTLDHCDLVAAEPVLKSYQKRCEARPAFGRALRGQLATFEMA